MDGGVVLYLPVLQQQELASLNSRPILTSLYCRAIKGSAKPGFLQNQNCNGIYKVCAGMVLYYYYLNYYLV